ncbi:hypothetical protein SPRG_20786 [Saprolegnia parasitica CBS 223.65]|uniref:Helicase-associated domain-containing protein n=1 Tax=Saprolegnia parasitica (strain CBS 223.65) TaxID=695850 RepID=A0A067CEJ9_SAPPC|nr:hypothetical protein SPRG_20786 [Saprolegnia parasitica CBS 223.65]KDO25207.1 hypothetical protein SPRG_20786 [Saprolegnia parasitica CBS 223.65]|eukprot:XP_012204113.1 hypothetical protein SPRG_20786 [Saprolegnia parasitica CBS 223.65]
MLSRAVATLVRRHPQLVQPQRSLTHVTSAATGLVPKNQIKPQRKAWGTTVLALERYKELHGHLQVPQSFKVEPSIRAAWPEETWDIALGRVVNNLRTQWRRNVLSSTQKHDLERLAFPFTGRTIIAWSTKLLALKTFCALEGHVNVPIAFIVPSDDVWPPVLHGMKLGKVVNAIRNQVESLPAHEKSQLDALGFVWSSWERSWDAKLLALETYHRRFNDLHVPRDFVVPKDDASWPKETWGIKLGLAVNNIRGRPERLTLGQLDALSSLVRVRGWKIYESLYDTNVVPDDFVVPPNDPAWPVSLHGVALGKLIQAMRHKPERLTVDELLELHELGYLTKT